jgi:TrmH family RNA methyltransferase
MLSKNDIKYYSSLNKKKYREQEGKFLIEGYHLIEECLSSSYSIECVIYSETITPDKKDKLLISFGTRNIPVHVISKNSFRKLSDTESSQGIAAVVNKNENTPVSSFFKSDLIVAIDRITDPGNLGTIIRTAYWFGAGGILIGENSVDLYNQKVIRSTQGALFHVNIINNNDLLDGLNELRANGFKIFLLDVKAPKYLSETEFVVKSVFVFGNEAEGISGDVLKHGYERISIKGYSACESLNVAVSSAIVMNEFRKNQKR